MAAHVIAQTHFGLCRRRQMKMRIKTCHAMQLIERSLRAFGEGLEFRLRQIPEAQLNSPQFVEDHVDRSRETAPFRVIGRRISCNCYPAY